MRTLRVTYTSLDSFEGIDIDFNVTTELESVVQRVVQRLHFFRGEYFINDNLGIPYLSDVLGHHPDIALAQQAITSQVRSVTDVDSVSNIETTLENRTLNYSATIHTRFGVAEIVISPQTFFTETPDVVGVGVPLQQEFTVDAGQNQTSLSRRTFTFSPSHSQTGTYIWTQTSGFPVIINDPETTAASFLVPHDEGSLSFELAVTNENGITIRDTITITVELDTQPRFAQTIIDFQYPAGTQIQTFVLPPAIDGNAPYTYAISGLPLGLEFGTLDRKVAGTPSQVIDTTVFYSATDSDNDTITIQFNINIFADSTPVFVATVPAQFLVQNDVYNQIFPSAIGGNGTLTYGLFGNIPDGLDFNGVSRTLSGTPTQANIEQTLIYRVFDEDGDTSQIEILFTVAADLSPQIPNTYPQFLSFLLGTQIDPITLPAAISGNLPITYSISGLPPGLMFAPLTRVISGTPSQHGDSIIIYTVTDTDNDSAAVNIPANVSINTQPMFSISISNRSYIEDIAIAEFALPIATGGNAPLTYSISTLPTGLVFDPQTRVLSGAPTALGSSIITYTVTDTDGDLQSITFGITVSEDTNPAFSSGVQSQSYIQGVVISALSLPTSTSGNLPITYSVSGLPPGLMFDPTTRVISGTPLNAHSGLTITYSAIDSDNDTATLIFSIVIVADTSPMFSSAVPNQSYIGDAAIDALTLPLAAGGNLPLTYSISNLPTGLAFNPSTRVLSGAPTAIGNSIITYTVTDVDGDTDTLMFNIVIFADTSPVFSTSIPNQSYIENTAITGFALPLASGGNTPLTYSISTLSNGLLFNPVTRILSGTPTDVGTTQITYTVTDNDGDLQSIMFGITVLEDTFPAFSSAVDTVQYIQGVAISELTLPESISGNQPITYSVSELPDGIVFNPQTRVISGTPLTIGGLTITYSATDADNDTATLNFIMFVNADTSPIFDSGIPNFTLEQQVLIAPVQLPLSHGGNSPITYSITTLPAGLTFNQHSSVLSGTPTTISAALQITYTATDVNNSTTSITFTITVIVQDTQPSFASGTNLIDINYFIGQTITPLSLPIATGGNEPLTYSIDGLPTGLMFDPDTRVISGEPIVLGDSIIVYRVTDTDGDIDTLGFTLTVSEVPIPEFLVYNDIPSTQSPNDDGEWTFNNPQGLSIFGSGRFNRNTISTGDTFELRIDCEDASGTNQELFLASFIVGDTLTISAYERSNNTVDYTAAHTLECIVTSIDSTSVDLCYEFGLEITAYTVLRSVDTFTASSFPPVNSERDNYQTRFIRIPGVLRFGETLSSVDYFTNSPIQALVLPSALSGNPPLTYSVSPLPPGLMFDQEERTITGTPLNAGTTTIIYSVVDDDSDGASLQFNITVIEDTMPVFSTSAANQSYPISDIIAPLTLPLANGGNLPLTYSISTLPSGLAFNPQTRILSGTPNVLGNTSITYTVTDSNDDSDSLTFDIYVDSTPIFSDTVEDYSYEINQQIIALQLPTAAGGNPPLAYSIPTIPTGLMFNPVTRILSGTPTDVGANVINYTVIDADGDSNSTTFNIFVFVDITPMFTGGVDDQTYSPDTQIQALSLPIATGGNVPLTYSVSTLPPGLIFNPDTRVISGEPTTGGAITVVYTVTDTDGDTDTIQFIINIASAPVFVGTVADISYLINDSIQDVILPFATGGNQPIVYSVSALPTGLMFNQSSRRLSGTPTDGGITEITYTATDANNNIDTLVFIITVVLNPMPMFPPAGMAYRVDEDIIQFDVGELIPTGITYFNNILYMTGAGMSRLYVLEPDSGIAEAVDETIIDFGVGEGFATGIAAVGNTLYMLGRNTNALYTLNTSTGVALRVSSIIDFGIAEQSPQGLAVIRNTLYMIGSTFDAFYSLNTSTGAATRIGSATAFGVGETVPTGLQSIGDTLYMVGLLNDWLYTVDISTGIAERVGTVDAFGAVNETNPTGLALIGDTLYMTGATNDALYTIPNALGTLTFVRNQQITEIKLPLATGGDEPLTYSISTLPPGISFNPSTRVLSGTPNTTGTTEITYTVIDTGGDIDTSVFKIIIDSRPSFSSSIGLQTYTKNINVSAVILPTANSGDAPLTYSVSELPDGIVFNPQTRSLSGTPTVSGNTSVTYTVTDDDGDTASIQFDITVVRLIPSFNSTFSSQQYIEGQSISFTRLPNAAGGDTPLIFSVSTLPTGLSFNPSNRRITGIPTTVSNTQITYTVTDNDGDTDTQNFNINVIADTAPVFESTVANRTYSEDIAIDSLTLPIAMGGNAPLTYSISTLPTGLAFNTNTRVLSGTPTDGGTTQITYTVTDNDDDTDTSVFDITIIEGAAPMFSGGTNNISLITDQQITNVTFPIATGGSPPLTYSVSTLPNGLMFNPVTRVLSGTPTNEGTTEITYTVTDTDGDIDTSVFDITVSEEDTSPMFPILLGASPLGAATRVGEVNRFGMVSEGFASGLAAIGDTLYMIGFSNNWLYTVDTSTGVATRVGEETSFNVFETRPEGIAFIGDTLYMVGGTINALHTLNTSTGAAIRVGSATAFGIGEESPTGLAAIGDTLYMVGLVNSWLYTVDTLTGVATRVGSVTSFDIGIFRASGLTSIGDTLYMVDFSGDALYTLNTSTGVAVKVGAVDDFGIGEGNPQGLAVIRNTLYMVGFTNDWLYRLAYKPTFTYNAGIAIDAPALTPATSGNEPLTYSIDGLPTEIMFNPQTRLLSGTPNTTGTTEITYKVTDSDGDTDTSVFNITVIEGAAPVFSVVANNINIITDRQITEVILPSATGSYQPLVYSVSTLPNGLIFNPSTRVISGIPTTVSNTQITYTVTDTNNDTDTLVFDIIIAVNLFPMFDITTSLDFSIQEILFVSQTLPVATGGNLPLTYSISTLPANLVFNPQTRLLSGIANTTGTTEITYTVTDYNGDIDTIVFDITIVESVPNFIGTQQNINIVQNQTYTGANSIQLISASGSEFPLVYSVSTLPSGLMFNPSNRVLSGSTTSTGITNIVYTVTDNDGDTDTQNFSINVAADLIPSFNGTVSNVSFHFQDNNITINLPSASGGNPPLIYGTGPLPSGLYFNSNTFQILGSPNLGAATTSVTYFVEDSNGDRDYIFFTIHITS